MLENRLFCIFNRKEIVELNLNVVKSNGIKHKVMGDKIECNLPIVSEPQEIWFTHFKVVDGVRNKPKIVRVIVEP